MTHPATRRNLLVCLAIVFSGGCSLDAGTRGPFGPEDPETAVQKVKLPHKAPAPHVFEFTGEETIGHHKPRMAGTIPDVPVKRTTNISAVLTSNEVATLRNAAERDRRVATLLGSRWAFIDADRIPPEGKLSFGCCRHTSNLARLVYYSYSQNVALEVQMKETNVLSVSRLDGYQPPEGRQDVQRGIELARADPRLAGKVEQLQGHGLLMQPDHGFFRNDPGYAHRTIWITFSHGQDGDPKYWAVVDLTEDKVLEAGEEPPRS
ncbi:MAG: hypothetical protein A4E19_00155 [Nitrospira sp. SG-bin1]|nr:MAG: hypothetical protein A4E19_00155 [Nitrospira sp. SG-bin1]